MKTLNEIIDEIYNQRIDFIRNNKAINVLKAGGSIYTLILSFNSQYNEYDGKHQKHKFMGIPLEFDSTLSKNEIKLS